MTLIQNVVNGMTSAEKNEMYDILQKERIAEEITGYQLECNMKLTEEQIHHAAELYVTNHSQYDCDDSHLENLMSVMKEAEKKVPLTDNEPIEDEPEEWEIGFKYERYGYIRVTAKTREEAIEAAYKRMNEMDVAQKEAATEYLPNSESIDRKNVIEIFETTVR